MIPEIGTVLIVLFCILAEGFFSGSEIAIISADKLKLRHHAEAGSRAARRVLELLERPERFFSTTLVGTNLATVMGTTVATIYFRDRFGESGGWMTLAVMPPLILLFGEIIPKSAFHASASRLAMVVAVPIRFAQTVLRPFVWLLSMFTDKVLGAFLTRDAQADPLVTRDELKLLLKLSGKGSDLKTEEKRMIAKIFRFGETKAEEVMVPLIDVFGIRDDTPVKEAIKLVIQSGYTRVPVFHDRIVNIRGVLNGFDLLGREQEPNSLEELRRDVLFVSEKQSIEKILFEFQRTQNPMAVVVDEYGGAAGIITMEDIIEEIVGEIEDEYDSGRQLYRKLSDRCYFVRGRMELDALGDVLGVSFPEGDYETVAGFMIQCLGRIPVEGDSVRQGSLVFSVRSATERAVNEIRVDLRTRTG